jgi:undecaprenyl-diphosphatase
MLELIIKYVSLFLITSQQIFYGIILGIVQGISEWLPISSKTQVLFVSTYLLGLNINEAYAFGLFMEIGTLFAAIIYFRKELVSLVTALIGRGEAESNMLLKYVVVSTIATAIIAAPIYLYLVDALTGAYNLGIPMLIIGLVLIGDALLIKYSRSKYADDKNRRTLSTLGIKEFILVGIAQGIAALPGVSRSGATTSTLLLLNVEASEAFRLSFIDMIFATAGAVVLTYIASKAQIASALAVIGIPGLAIAIIVATIVSLLLINFLLGIAKKSSIVYLTSALGIIALISGGLILFFNIAA